MLEQDGEFEEFTCKAAHRSGHTCCWVVARLLAVCICTGYCASDALFWPSVLQRSCRPLAAALIHPGWASSHLSVSIASVTVLVRRSSQKESL